MAKISEQHIAQLLEQSLDLMLLIDPADLKLLFVNQHGAEMLKLERDKLLDQATPTLLPELSGPELEAMIELIIETDPTAGETLVTVVRDGVGDDRDFEFRLKKVLIDDKPFIMANGRDVSERVAVTDQVQTMLADAQMESQQDTTTHLFQRETFLQIFRELMEQLGQGDLRLSLMILDLKNLHLINQEYGQAVGDKVLAHVGKLMHHVARPDDVGARFSGRKLCMLLPHSGQQDALVLAEKITRALSRMQYSEFPNLRVHSSIGVAELPEPGEAELLIDKAISLLRDAHTEVKHEIHRLGLVSLNF